jgi:hypothetical protein
MLAGLAKEVQKRMECVGVRGSHITLKLKQRKKGAPPPPKFLGHGSCHSLSKSREISTGPTRDWEIMQSIGKSLFAEMNVETDDIRGMGIVVSKLDISSSESPGATTAQAQSIKNWFGSRSEGVDKATKDNHPDFMHDEKLENATAESPPFPALVQESDDATPMNPSDASLQAASNKINESVMTELPQQKEAQSKEMSSVLLLEDDEVLCSETEVVEEETMILSQESVEPVDDEQVDSGSREEYRPSTPESDQNFWDVDLPPLSQIHMSQVAALPSPLRKQITSKVSENSKANTAANVEKMLAKANPVHDDPSGRLRQVSVKRMFRLAEVKSGKIDDNSILASELANLPLKMQLQVANNDNCAVGSLCPTAKAGRANFSRKNPPNAKKTSSKPLLPRKRAEGCKPQNEVSHQNPDRETDKASITDAGGHSEVDDTDDPDSAPCGDFYEENVAPLTVFMNENPDANDEAQDQLIDFLCICIKEHRLYDAVLLLRHIKNRRDRWSGSAYGPIFSKVDEACNEVEGCRLDREGLGL